jgi:putative membrane protein
VANERTFLAWIRTALALLGFGFLLARVGLFLRQIAGQESSGNGNRHAHEFLLVGTVFLFLGTLLSAWSGWNYRATSRAIESNSFTPKNGAVLLVTIIAVAAGIAIMLLVVLGSLR